MLYIFEAFRILYFFSLVISTYYLHGEIEVFHWLAFHADVDALA